MNTNPSLHHANRNNSMSRPGLTHRSKAARTRTLNAVAARESLLQAQKELNRFKHIQLKLLRGTNTQIRGML